MRPAPAAASPGLPRERTSLAWSRTALALLTNGALLLVRDPLGTPAGALLGAVALVLAAGTALVARRRVQLLQLGVRPPAAGGEVLVLGLSVGVLSVAVGAAVLLR